MVIVFSLTFSLLYLYLNFRPFLFQDAKKGVLFLDFPPVLQLQLKRFEYDYMRDTMVKVRIVLNVTIKMTLPILHLYKFWLLWHASGSEGLASTKLLDSTDETHALFFRLPNLSISHFKLYAVFFSYWLGWTNFFQITWSNFLKVGNNLHKINVIVSVTPSHIK